MSDKIYAVKNSKIVKDITGANILPDGCTRYISPQWLIPHESGCPQWKIIDNNPVQLTLAEMKLEPEYIAWKKAKREDLIVRLIRTQMSQNKEYQILRRAIAKIANNEAVEQEFVDYNTFVEGILTNNPEE